MDAAQEARLLTAAEEAARIVAEADCVLFMSGAGMGVDSGIGTFRGANAGKWPPLEERRMDFSQMSTPSWFEEDGDPHLAFGFWFWRFQGYTEAKPHEGYYMVQRWAKNKPCRSMSYTSNIDGHWLEAGMPEDSVVEIHGSIRYWQCRDFCKEKCTDEIWKDTLDVKIDPTTHKAIATEEHPLPLCKNCKSAYKRPNVCMFGDYGWIPTRTAQQEERWDTYIKTLAGKKIAVLEIGAGTAIPSVRLEGERIVKNNDGAHLIRINLEQSSLMGVYSGRVARGVSLPCGGLRGLKLIESFLPK